MTIEQKPLQDLICLLEEESSIYVQLHELLEQERQALLHLSPSDLGEIGARKETLALRIKALDESRKVLGGRLGRMLGIDPDQLTVTAMIERIPSDLAGRLERVRHELKERALACKEANDFNSRAARRGLDLINSTIEHLLSDPDPAGKVYQNKGGYGNSGRQSPVMVSREV